MNRHEGVVLLFVRLRTPTSFEHSRADVCGKHRVAIPAAPGKRRNAMIRVILPTVSAFVSLMAVWAITATVV